MSSNGLPREIKSSLVTFLAVTRAEHFMVYLPYEGNRLLDFLDSCYHRNFTDLLESKGYVQTALFTTKTRNGHLFSLLSRGNKPFTMANLKALQATGVFDRAFGQAHSTVVLPCLSLLSNSLLVEISNFYEPGRRNMESYGWESGAEWLASCKAVMEGYYDRLNQAFSTRRVPHSCDHNTWCQNPLEHTDFKPEDLFAPAWSTPSLTVIDVVVPYRLMNVLSQDLQISQDIDLTYSKFQFPEPPGQEQFLRPRSEIECESLKRENERLPADGDGTIKPKPHRQSTNKIVASPMDGLISVMPQDLSGRMTHGSSPGTKSATAESLSLLEPEDSVDDDECPSVSSEDSVDDELSEGLSLDPNLLRRLLSLDHKSQRQNGKENERTELDWPKHAVLIAGEKNNQYASLEREPRAIDQDEIESVISVPAENGETIAIIEQESPRRENDARREKKKQYRKRLKAGKKASRSPL